MRKPMEKNKKVVQINTVFRASTGRIMLEIQKCAESVGYETISFVGRPPRTDEVKGRIFGNWISFWSHVLITTVFDAQGYGSYFATKKLIRWLREENPDIIHLHNLHGYYLHIPMFCHYLKEEYRGKVFWTFHDCWPVTGHCAHFVSASCMKWRTECCKCPKKTDYPISLFIDASKRNYLMKKKYFSQIPNLTIIVPSQWLKNVVKQSFLYDKRVEVVNNGIDFEKFNVDKDYTIFEKYHIPANKKIILGVSSVWNKSKGFFDFINLSKALSNEYHIVLVGLTKMQKKKLPIEITGIEKIQCRDELIKIYSNAHIFLNPSIEESFSLVTVEAMACGVPVIVLNTSAVSELVDESCGEILSEHNPQNYIDAILKIENRKLKADDIRKHAQKYNIRSMTQRVLELYEELE